MSHGHHGGHGNPATDQNGQVLTDDDMEAALDTFATDASSQEVNDLLKTMNENSIISWDEAEHIMAESSTESGIAKCGLPVQVRPSEPENTTEIGTCVQQLYSNDPSLTTININNMKRTPIPDIQKIMYALRDNEHLVKLSMANVNLSDAALEPILEILAVNKTLKYLNLETNYLSGEFLARLFQTLNINQTVEEVHAVNQGATFSTQAEMDIGAAICENKKLVKVGITFRKHEVRIKVDQTLLRNNELRRIMRREEAKFKAQQAAQQGN